MAARILPITAVTALLVAGFPSIVPAQTGDESTEAKPVNESIWTRDKLFGTWEGLSVDMHARRRFGDDIGADAGALTLPNTGLLRPLPGDYHDTDITGLTVNQMFALGDKHLGMATAGKLDIIDAVTLFFPSAGYGQEGFWNVNALVSALPWFGAAGATKKEAISSQFFSLSGYRVMGSELR